MRTRDRTSLAQRIPRGVSGRVPKEVVLEEKCQATGVEGRCTVAASMVELPVVVRDSMILVRDNMSTAGRDAGGAGGRPPHDA